VQTTSSTPLALLSLVALTGACAPEPVYDDDLGLQAVSTAPGALAGTFAHKTSVTRLGEFPVVGPQETGGDTYFLVTRTETSDGEGYDVDVSPCGGWTFPTPAGESIMPHETYQAAEVIGAPVITVDHELGTYAANDYLELWGISDLPDPMSTPLPVDSAEAEAEPHASRIWDADDDGNPGMTSHIQGVAIGDVYFIQRRRFDWEGLVLSEDRLVGLTTSRPEKTVIGADNDLLNNQFTEGPHPDPKQAWFEQVRLADGAGCDDVIAAVEDELISRIRPF
jgi:hypothetical protein